MSWPLVKLADVCNVIMGQAPEGSSYNEAGEGVPLLAGAGDFGEITPAPKKFTTEASKLSQSGDLILCIRATIGDLNWSDRAYCLGRGVAGLRVIEDKLDASYLWHFICHHKRDLASKGTGSTFKQVNRTHIAEWEIPLPPLPEQKRIAAILDKADAIRRKRQQAIQLADEFLRAVFLDMFGDPVTNPKGWEVKPLGSFCSFQGGFAFKSSDYADSGVPLVKISNVHFENVEWEDVSYVAEGFLASRSEFSLKTGDLVMAMTRPIIKSLNSVKLVEIKEKDIPALLNQRVGRFIGYEDVIARDFLKYFLYSDYFKSEVEKLCSVALQPNVSSKQIESIYCYLPPRTIQEQFSRIVSSVSVFEPKLKVAAIENLVTTLSQKAFAGQL